MNRAAIEFKNISFSYPKSEKKALDEVSASFPSGETTAVIGANGSGKSTLLRIIAGLLIPQDGDLNIEGTRVDDDNVDKLLRDIGIVFQNPEAQFVASTIREDIAFGLENRRIKPADMDSIIDKVAKKTGITDLLSREPNTLSGGQKQRCAIASILALHPKILLLDEATSMLDPLSRRDIFELLSKIKKDDPDLTIIEVTHDWKEAAKADHLVALKGGRVAYQGDPAAIIDDVERAEELGVNPSFEAELKSDLEKSLGNMKSFRTPEELMRCLKH